MVNEDTIKKRIAALDSDIKVMTNTIQEIDAKKQEAIANLNALHGAKQQCESFLKELDNDDQTAQAVAGS
jgi:prefoldin subunit 5